MFALSERFCEVCLWVRSLLQRFLLLIALDLPSMPDLPESSRGENAQNQVQKEEFFLFVILIHLLPCSTFNCAFTGH